MAPPAYIRHDHLLHGFGGPSVFEKILLNHSKRLKLKIPKCHTRNMAGDKVIC
ncbi:Uncharacterized protein dnm_072050 [Desulfonema magnum]|uniref:Uncharacterized protein n=1 Tax=Desulfonema magnum TaxID=45655 RepID=A0A975GRP6_9BACT|nr:Uncharacterized protein dnm_072050 [Desulfonema magnum]